MIGTAGAPARQPPGSPATVAVDAAQAAAEAAGVRVGPAQLIRLRHEARSISLSALRLSMGQSGLKHSPFRGRGMEFEETRRYEAGDDVRHLDWRVTARTGDLHTKLYREERERPVVVWVDFRAQMFFATQGRFKSVQAARLAALLAWSAVAHGDRIGGIVFSAATHREIRPRGGSRSALRLIHELCVHPAWQDSGDAVTRDAPDDAGDAALVRLRRLVRPGSLLFMLSDFRDIGDNADTHLAALAAHNDVVAVWLDDRMEREPPPANRYRLAFGPDQMTLETGNRKLRAAWVQAHRERQTALATFCRRNGIHFTHCSTADDASAVLRDTLSARPRGPMARPGPR